MKSSKPPLNLHVSAAIAAWLWPGMGHVMNGQSRRGLLIMVGVLFLFLTGVLIGGIDCVDRREDRLWFIAQAGCGPIALVTDFANQTYIKALPPDRRLHTTGLARVNEMGTLFTALAGLMNIVAVLDALTGRVPTALPGSRPQRRASDHTSDAAFTATAASTQTETALAASTAENTSRNQT